MRVNAVYAVFQHNNIRLKRAKVNTLFSRA